MPKFLVQNLTEKPVRLGIEPWAELEILAPDGRAEFEYDEPAEISFSFTDDGGASVGIISDRIKVTVDGTQKIIEPAE